MGLQSLNDLWNFLVDLIIFVNLMAILKWFDLTILSERGSNSERFAHETMNLLIASNHRLYS